MPIGAATQSGSDVDEIFFQVLLLGFVGLIFFSKLISQF
jgi:hypothetical protein